MIVYSDTKKNFQRDIANGVIAERLDRLFTGLGITRESKAEFNSWKASLPQMGMIVSDRRIDDSVRVALEYRIPLTSKRVDFMVAGNNGISDNVVIVELKQWESCEATSRDNVVKAFIGGAVREVAHPSQQAYSYAKLIENFNEDVRANSISLIPCAYLHNYKEEARQHICHKKYNEVIKEAPLFLKEDGTKLTDYIVRFAPKPSIKELFEIIENGKLKPSKALQDAVGSILNGNDEFTMIDEQQVAYATILKLVENTIEDSTKHVIIVQGGPGTGKSVIAINLLAKINNNGFSCAYVTKTSAPRYTFSRSFIKGKYTLDYLGKLFKSSGTFYDVEKDKYDCLLVDEAHRLNLKSGLYSNIGENQIKEIINASKISVFYVDEDQIVTMQDIGTIKEIEKQAEALGAIIHKGESLKLSSQFRCNGSDGYISFLDDVLQIRSTANRDYFDIDYDIRIFDDASLMRETLRQYNRNNKARMIAGYCYQWKSKKDKNEYDIQFPGGFKAQWNFTTEKFATDPDSFEQVGCIHSTQGLEFDYVGIIIGNDLRYENGIVITDYTKRDKNDKTMVKSIAKKDPDLADRIIRNTYKTLLSRGQKGCFIYCEDNALRDYLRQRLDAVERTKPILDVISESVDVEEEDSTIQIPLVGEIAAGHEWVMDEDIECYLPIDRKYVDSTEPGKFFILQVNGDSMIGADIFDGDYVLVRRSSWPQRGSIVACMLGGDRATLKRFFPGDDTVTLMPENSSYEPIIVNSEQFEMGEAKILGVVKRIFPRDEIIR